MYSEKLMKLGKPLKTFMNCRNNVCVQYDRCEIKEGSFLIDQHGEGKTYEEACEDYYNKIGGKRLVFNACSEEERHEVVVL